MIINESLSLLENDITFYCNNIFETALLPGPVYTSKSFKEKIQHIINSIKEYIEKFFKQIIASLIKLYEKVRDNTVRDKILKNTIGNLSYDDLMEAKRNGWKGIPSDAYCISIPKKENGFLYKNLKEVIGPDSDNIYNMASDLKKLEDENNIEKAKEYYQNIINKIDKLKKDADVRYHGWVEQLVKNKSGVYYDNMHQHRDFSDKISHNFYYPSKNDFEEMKDFVLNCQSKVASIRKNFLLDFKFMVENSIQSNNLELKQLGNNESIRTYILKAYIAIDSFKLKVSQNIIKELITITNTMFHQAFQTYITIVNSYNIFKAKENIKKEIKQEMTFESIFESGNIFMNENTECNTKKDKEEIKQFEENNLEDCSLSEDAQNYYNSMLNKEIEENYQFLYEATNNYLLEASKDPEKQERLNIMKTLSQIVIKFFKSRDIDAKVKALQYSSVNKDFVEGKTKVIHMPLDEKLFANMNIRNPMKISAGIHGVLPVITAQKDIGSNKKYTKNTIYNWLNNSVALNIFKTEFNEKYKDFKVLKVTRSNEVFGIKFTIGTEQEFEDIANQTSNN